jgi:RHS repeat-associated protein
LFYPLIPNGAFTWQTVASQTTQTFVDVPSDPNGCNALQVQANDASGPASAWKSTDRIPLNQTTQYYNLRNQTIAVRRVDTQHTNPSDPTAGLAYLTGDQVSSTSLVTDPNGQVVAATRYSPYGQVRSQIGVLPTDKTYTGQKSDSFGMLDYNARFYDPYLNQWASPDSVIPDQYNPLDWNRYAYVRYNPINHNDPTGHRVDDGCRSEGCDPKEIAYAELKFAQEKCQSGNRSGCNNPVEIAVTGVVGLVGIAALGVVASGGIVVSSGTAGTAATVGGTAEAVNTACGGDVCEGEIETGEQYVYRALQVGENPNNGLSARLADAGDKISSHVNGLKNSQWISTSRSGTITFNKWYTPGNGFVQIDLTKVESEIVDISNGIPGMENTRPSNWARAFQEVLIKNYIPPDAIKIMIPGGL